MMRLSIPIYMMLLMAGACSKNDSGGTNQTAPTNLVVTATVSTDGSGKVDFVAKADNAFSYDFEYGNGVAQTVPSGVVSYTYTTVGTNTYPVVVTAKSIAGLTLKKSLSVTITVNEPYTTLVWSDEFDVNGYPGSANWTPETGTGTNGWGNNELQYYTDRSANAEVQDGVLRIKAKKEDYNGSAYTSARLISKAKFDFKYGKVEVRAKLPAGVGTWPAVWMLGSDISSVGWPACGEIDIMEHRGSELNKIFGTLHYPGRSGGNADGNTTMISNATTAFHRYGLEWSAQVIKISVDDVVFHTVQNTNSIPFNKNFFFILNVAMGGTFAGAVDPAFQDASLEVDYIRVYK